MKKEIFRAAFVRSIPILCSYIFVSMAYGIMMQNAGFPWFASLFVSLTVYTGAFQFVLITFLSSGASLLTVALTAFLMNSRQTFYSLTFLKEFRAMGKWKLYMIHTMTDETYAVNCTLDLPEKEKQDTMFLVAFLSRCYWMMTALFVIIFIDQWEKTKKHTPALAGLAIGTLCLVLFGQQRFMLPALLGVSGLLVFMQAGGRAHESE